MTSHLPHHDPDTCRLIERARAEGAARVLRDVEALDVTALVGKWRNASDAARASEHHWPADCLAEAAEVVTQLAAHDAEARRTAAKETGERIARAIEAECPGDPRGHKMRPCGPCRNAARIARAEADR